MQGNGPREGRLPGNLNLAIDGGDHETLLIRLDLMGFAVSAGSACSAGSLEPSRPDGDGAGTGAGSDSHPRDARSLHDGRGD